MKRYGVCLALTSLLLLAACGGSDGDDADDAAAPSGSQSGSQSGDCTEVDEIKIGFPGLPPDFVQMGTPLADRRGVFEKYCIDVEFIGVESGIAAFRAMAAGEFAFSYSGSISPILAKGEGADAKIFMSPAALLDFQIVALPGHESCEKLKGERVATDGPGGLIHALMEQFLATCDLNINKDVSVAIGDPETFGAQLAAEAVVATAAHLDERISIQKDLGVDLQVIDNAWEYAPDFHYASLSTAGDALRDNRDLYVRISAAILESNAWLVDPANRAEAIPLISEISEQSEEVVTEVYDTFAKNFPDTCERALPEKAYEFLIDLQLELGNLAEPVEVSDLVDQSVCQDATKLVAERAS